MSKHPVKERDEITREVEEKIEIQKVSPLKNKLSQMERSYKELENEFRDALKSEESRFSKLKFAFEQSEADLTRCKYEREGLKENLEKNLKLMAELNMIIKERKGGWGDLGAVVGVNINFNVK